MRMAAARESAKGDSWRIQRAALGAILLFAACEASLLLLDVLHEGHFVDIRAVVCEVVLGGYLKGWGWQIA